VDSGLGRIAQACRVVKLARSGYYRVKKISRSSQHPRYGYRRITALLRRKGRRVNAKRVARVRRAEGLQVRKRQRRTQRLGPSQT
jgi:putative transposase